MVAVMEDRRQGFLPRQDFRLFVLPRQRFRLPRQGFRLPRQERRQKF
jgi:hypothetical protein